MSQAIDDYIKRFANLHTDISAARWPELTRHRAPHKPLLLLSVIDLFAQGSMNKNLIEITPDLGELFTLYWARVMPAEHRGNIALPFFHLKSDGFWHLIPRPGKEDFVASASQIRSTNKLREVILGAKLDGELYECFCVEKARDLLRTILIKTYFAPQAQKALIDQGEINHEAFHYSEILLEHALTKRVKDSGILYDQYKSAVRDQGFRRVVVKAYNHRCAMCGIRMLTADGHTVVDAAHIVPWNISHNNDPRNGMALCRLCHWTFDKGLASVSSRYMVITSPQITSYNNVPGHILTLSGRSIIGPIEKALWPDIEALIWHRKSVFRKR